MATKFDDIFRKVGKDLTELFGVSTGQGTYNHYTTGVMDDDTNTVSNVLDSQPIEMSPPLKYKKSDVDGETIMKSDHFVIISGEHWDAVFSGKKPGTNDTIEINGEKFSVMNPDRIYSGDQIAAYKIQVRKGSA